MPARIHLVTGRDLNVDDEADDIVRALTRDGSAAVQVPGATGVTHVLLAGVAYVAQVAGEAR